MRTFISIFITCCFGSFTFGQSGIITYQVEQKLEITMDGDGEAGLSAAFKSMMPESQSFTKELLFNNNISLFRDQKGGESGDLELSSEDGSIQIKLSTRDEVGEELYLDHNSKKKFHKKGIMGKPFIINDDLTKLNWKITTEKVKYLDYVCLKAIFEDGDNLVVAWFTPEIAPNLGPDKYHSLPGTILLLNINDGFTEYRATEIILQPLNEKLEKPSKGKKVSQEEFDEIKAEKDAEMQEMTGNRMKKIEIRNE